MDHQNISQWYDEMYSNEATQIERPIQSYHMFFDFLKPVTAGQRLLDIACGLGYLSQVAAQAGLETAGVDISEEAIKHAQKISPTTDFTVGVAEELSHPDKQFDYVVCLGSLEHFLDIDGALQEMRRVAKPNAQFLLVVPNIHYIAYRVRGQFGTAQQDIQEELLDLEQWKKIFVDNGFEIDKIDHDYWYRDAIQVFSSPNPLRIVRNLFYKAVWAVLPLRYTYQFVFVLR